jgi:cation:H+ antiporter
MANMLILGMVSLLPGSELFRRTALDNALLIAFAILLTAMGAVAVLMEPRFTVLGVDPAPVMIAVVYLAGTRLLLRHTTVMREAGTETETVSGSGPADDHAEGGGWSLRKGLLAFGGGALLVLLAGPFFARYAAGLARLTGLEASFVGTWLVGFSTSLPELVTTVAAVRMGSYDLAVGNLYGSNAFNMLLLLPLDLVHGGGPLLDAVDPVHALSGLVAVALMSIGLAAVVYRAKGRLSMLEPNGLLMILAYAAGMALIFASGAGGG